MTYLSSNIKKIRTLKNLSQTKFAELFSITRASVGAYEEGRAKPKMELLLKIANKFSISIEEFVTRELTVNEISQFNSISDKYIKQNPSSIEHLKHSDIHFIDSSMVKEFVQSDNRKSFLRKQPIIAFPFKLKKIKLALKISESEIKLEDKSVINGNIILCEKLDKETMLNQESAYLFCIDKNKSAFIAFYEINQDQKIITSVETKKQHTINDIDVIWKIDGVINFNIQPPALLEKRISDLEESFKRLNKYMDKD